MGNSGKEDQADPVPASGPGGFLALDVQPQLWVPVALLPTAGEVHFKPVGTVVAAGEPLTESDVERAHTGRTGGRAYCRYGPGDPDQRI